MASEAVGSGSIPLGTTMRDAAQPHLKFSGCAAKDLRTISVNERSFHLYEFLCLVLRTKSVSERVITIAKSNRSSRSSKNGLLNVERSSNNRALYMKPSARNILFAILCLSVLAPSAPTAHAKPAKVSLAKSKTGKPPTAASLIGDMQKSLAHIVKNSKGKISSKSATTRPYWSSLQSISAGLGDMSAGVTAKDKRMLTGLNTLARTTPELTASWGVLEKKYPNPAVSQGMKAFFNSYNLYTKNYGPAAARRAKGGTISTVEKAKLNEFRAAAGGKRAQLQSLRASAKPDSQPLRMIADLIYLLDALDRLTGDDLNIYCDYIYYYDEFNSYAYGYGSIIEVWYPEFYVSWSPFGQQSYEWTTSFYTESETYYSSWDYTSIEITDYDSYYEEVSLVTEQVSVEDIEMSESYTESYSEEVATEVTVEETSLVNENVEVSEDASGTFSDPYADQNDDESGAEDETTEDPATEETDEEPSPAEDDSSADDSSADDSSADDSADEASAEEESTEDYGAEDDSGGNDGGGDSEE